MEELFVGDPDAQAAAVAHALAPVCISPPTAVGIVLAILILAAIALTDAFAPEKGPRR